MKNWEFKSKKNRHSGHPDMTSIFNQLKEFLLEKILNSQNYFIDFLFDRKKDKEKVRKKRKIFSVNQGNFK